MRLTKALFHITFSAMTNRVCIIPIGDPAPAQDVVAAIWPEGKPIEIKNKYFEAAISYDFETGGLPPAVMWISHSSFVDKRPPPTGEYPNAELRLLLRVVDASSDADMSEALKDWEVDNLAEIVNVNIKTLDEEIRKFREGGGRASLLDEAAQPAGCRILESLEVVNWPIKASAGKSVIEQKIEKLKAMLANQDPHSDSFENALQMMMELKSEIPNLPDEQRHKYAAQVALAFEAALMAGLEEEEEEEAKEEAPFQKMPSDDGEGDGEKKEEV